jgi:hypothetical protein
MTGARPGLLHAGMAVRFLSHDELEEQTVPPCTT